MKERHRIHKIEMLAVVGFSSTELQRMTNSQLDATYEAAKPLMQARREEIEKVRRMESLHNAEIKRRIASRQRHFSERQREQMHQRQLEEEWRRSFKLPPPIQAVNLIGGVDNESLIVMYDEVYERERALFAQKGTKDGMEHANAANAAREARDRLIRARSNGIYNGQQKEAK
jgi:hypothetical protein